MKKYDLKTEKGQKAYFKDRQVILKQYDVEIKKDWHGEEATFDTGYVQLDGITAECLQKLIDSGFADSNDTQNEAPSIQEFLEFLRNHPESTLTAHGHMTTPTRPDARVSIEGLEGGLAQDDLKDFVEMFYQADELSIDTPEDSDQFAVRCWYD